MATDVFEYLGDYKKLIEKEAELDKLKRDLEEEFRRTHSKKIGLALMVGALAVTAVVPAIRIMTK